MLKYILKRVLIFIPTLIIISLLTFVISTNAPGDPVDTMLNKSAGGDGQASEKMSTEKAYNDLRHQLGLDLPVFYFNITNSTYSDTLYKIANSVHKETLERISFKYGNWKHTADYYNNIRKLEFALLNIEKNPEHSAELRRAKDYVNSLYAAYEENKIKNVFSNLDFIFESTPSLSKAKVNYNATENAWHTLLHEQSGLNKYIPEIHWYGFDNQYHRWIFGDKPWLSSLPWVDDSEVTFKNKGFLRGDFGISYQDKRPVSSVLWDAMQWTFILSMLSVLIAYFVAIPLGVKSAVSKGTKTEKSITTVLFVLYSLPNFWIATMLIIFFAGGDYFDWFPAFGLGSLPSSAPFMDRFFETAYHFILPLICLTYASFAFISRQMRGGMLNVLGQDYIRTARAKGLNENTVIWKHAFRNSLIPIITLFASIFPAAISGSFVIEYIFSIPGMGKISLDALIARNYPIVFTVMLFTAILTLVGNLVADILYAVVDPRISFSKKNK
ncbi:MAG: ABC transporter permease [Bacteroidota bacterium]|nr:ABC transporter permease [Bacteroidota bacterium]